ncbi:MAG: hypothetical protein ACXV4A_04255 [Actinomycetes bacterium]
MGGAWVVPARRLLEPAVDDFFPDGGLVALPCWPARLFPALATPDTAAPLPAPGVAVLRAALRPSLLDGLSWGAVAFRPAGPEGECVLVPRTPG